MMPSLFRDLRDSLRSPYYWAYSTWLEVIAKYRRSRLGLIWAMVPAIAYIWGMGSFFAAMRHMPLSVMVPHVALGTLVFRLLTSCITEGAGVFGAHQSFILDNRVRLSDLILRTLSKALFYVVVALPAVAVALWISETVVWTGLLIAVGTFGLIIINALWMAVFVALLGARFSDAQELIGSIMLFVYLLTPIIWFKQDMPAETVRGDFMRINPLFHLIEIFRAPILGEPVETMSIVYVAIWTVVGCSLAAWAYRRYARHVPIWI